MPTDSDFLVKMAAKGKHKMCSGCAFRKGTEANKTFSDAAVHAVLWEHDFRCHMQERKCGGFLNAIGAHVEHKKAPSTRQGAESTNLTTLS